MKVLWASNGTRTHTHTHAQKPREEQGNETSPLVSEDQGLFGHLHWGCLFSQWCLKKQQSNDGTCSDACTGTRNPAHRAGKPVWTAKKKEEKRRRKKNDEKRRRKMQTQKKLQQEWDTNLQQTTPFFPHSLQRNAAETRRKLQLMQKNKHISTHFTTASTGCGTELQKNSPCFYFLVSLINIKWSCPDITIMADWVLKLNYSSIYECSKHLGNMHLNLFTFTFPAKLLSFYHISRVLWLTMCTTDIMHQSSYEKMKCV